MAEAPAELLVIDKTYVLVLWTANHVAKFPRTHKFTLGERLIKQVYTILEGLLRAKYTRDRASCCGGSIWSWKSCGFSFGWPGI